MEMSPIIDDCPGIIWERGWVTPWGCTGSYSLSLASGDSSHLSHNHVPISVLSIHVYIYIFTARYVASKTRESVEYIHSDRPDMTTFCAFIKNCTNTVWKLYGRDINSRQSLQILRNTVGYGKDVKMDKQTERQEQTWQLFISLCRIPALI